MAESCYLIDVILEHQFPPTGQMDEMIMVGWWMDV